MAKTRISTLLGSRSFGVRTSVYNNIVSSIPTPAQILGSNYRDHWRAEDLSSVGDGNDVVNWQSVGIDARTMKSFSFVTRAQYVSNFLGFPAVQTTGNARYKIPSSFSDYNYLHDGTGGTIIYIARHAVPTAVSVITANSIGTADTGHLNVFRDSATNPDCVEILATRNVGGTLTVRNQQNNVQNREEIFLLQSTIVNDSSASERSKMWLNQNSVPYQNNVATNSFLSGGASHDLSIMCRPAGDLRWIGQIFEIIISDTAITQAQATQIQAWYNAKYGLFPIS